MYLAGVSTRRVADITEALWDTRVSSATISKRNQSVYEHIEKWRNRPIEGEFPYVYLDGVSLKRRWGGEAGNVSVLIAIGVGTNGHRRILEVVEGAKEDKAGWSGFLRHLKSRELSGVRMFISDACLGLVESLGDFYPDVLWQRCVVHFYRNVFSYVPRGKVDMVWSVMNRGSCLVPCGRGVVQEATPAAPDRLDCPGDLNRGSRASAWRDGRNRLYVIDVRIP